MPCLPHVVLFGGLFFAAGSSVIAEEPPAKAAQAQQNPWDAWHFEPYPFKPPELPVWERFEPSHLPEGLKVELSQRRGKDAVVVGTASGVDWLLRSSDAGEHWSRPLFVPPFPPAGKSEKANLPPCPWEMFEPKRWPQWQTLPHVERPVIQGDTLSFEVVQSCGHKDEVSHSIASVRLDVLAQDTDKDGLTDLFEALFRLDPKNPDTDADGIPDDIDPLPQIPVSQKGGVPVALAWKWAHNTRGEISIPRSDESKDAQLRVLSDGGFRTRCLVGNRELLQNPTVPERTIVISGGGLAPGSCYFGFWPRQDNKDKDRFQIHWNASHYAGGNATAVRTKDGWTITGNGRWEQ